MVFSLHWNCYALYFILSYDGPNPVLLRIQMRLMLWTMDIYHQPADLMVQPDYLSRLHANLCYDELTRTYLNFKSNLRRTFSPTTGPMVAENIPGYRTPRIWTTLPVKAATVPATTAAVTNKSFDAHIAPILLAIHLRHSGGHHFCLQTIPILSGSMNMSDVPSPRPTPFYNQAISFIGLEALAYTFPFYGFSNGYFVSRTLNAALTFNTAIDVDTRRCGRTMFKPIHMVSAYRWFGTRSVLFHLIYLIDLHNPRVYHTCLLIPPSWDWETILDGSSGNCPRLTLYTFSWLVDH